MGDGGTYDAYAEVRGGGGGLGCPRTARQASVACTNPAEKNVDAYSKLRFPVPLFFLAASRTTVAILASTND